MTEKKPAKKRTATKKPATPKGRDYTGVQISTKTAQNNFAKAYLANNGNVTKACKEVGIDRRTYYNWLEDDNFKNLLDDATESFHDMIESVFMDKVFSGDTACLIFTMKTKLRKRGYDEKPQQDTNEQPKFTVNISRD